jgi:hypothetical protein
VISLLNRYFVPVYSSNQETCATGGASPKEKAERHRIYDEQLRTGRVGDVFVYILSPDGHPIDGVDIGTASNRCDLLIRSLEQAAQRLKTIPGPSVVKPAAESPPAVDSPDSLVLHLVARGFRRGSWREFPGENWIILTRAESTRMLPDVTVETGVSWSLNRELTTKLLTNFYPQTEDASSADRNRIDEESLRATVLSVRNGVARARIDGSLKMKRTFYPHHPDNNFVNAKILGFVDFEIAAGKVDTLKLVTTRATYGSVNPEEFGAGLETVAVKDAE